MSGWFYDSLLFLACPAISWMGDGYCNDASNIEECQFDGGDCCLETVNSLTCTVCLCHETGITAPSGAGGKL
jgi:hypothetical protein